MGPLRALCSGHRQAPQGRGQPAQSRAQNPPLSHQQREAGPASSSERTPAPRSSQEKPGWMRTGLRTSRPLLARGQRHSLMAFSAQPGSHCVHTQHQCPPRAAPLRISTEYIAAHPFLFQTCPAPPHAATCGSQNHIPRHHSDPYRGLRLHIPLRPAPPIQLLTVFIPLPQQRCLPPSSP